MAHLVRKKWNELKVGDMIKLKGDDRIWQIDEKTGGANFTVEWLPEHADFDDREIKEVVYGQDYEGSLVFSKSCKEAMRAFRGVSLEDTTDEGIFGHAWSECEKHYGIRVEETDPIRLLAFAILLGDPMACDAARDILKS